MSEQQNQINLDDKKIQQILSGVDYSKSAGRYSQSYSEIIKINQQLIDDGKPSLDKATLFWFTKAVDINADNPSDASNVFIREVSAAGKLADGIPVGNLQDTS